MSPGVYLFKDAGGTVLYVGKAASLRQRVSSYFQPSADLLASRGPEIERMIREQVADVSWIESDSEVDAILRENRLVKDIQPRYNVRLKDGKSFPYLRITSDEDFPRVSITRNPGRGPARLFGPFVHPHDLRRSLPLLQRVFRFRTCGRDIDANDPKRQYNRPCLLYSIGRCTAPCAGLVSREDYADRIRRLKQFLESKGTKLTRELKQQMREAAERREYERAAALRDELKALDGLRARDLGGEEMQPELFYSDPSAGLAILGDILGRGSPPRTIEGVDIAHLHGTDSCGAIVCFIDGRPFRHRYRRYRIRESAGDDDCAAVREVVARRYRRKKEPDEDLFPDLLLVDGGPAQLSAAGAAFASLDTDPPALVALAKKEELLYVPGVDEPLRRERRDPALRLLQAVRDEAHRFARHYHHILRKKTTLGE